VAERGVPDEREVTIVLRVDLGSAVSGVSGTIRSPYGEAPFHGWLDLLGRIEAVADRARERVRDG
jgi:hypothetical protein